MSGFFGAGGMGGNVERHIGDDDRDGAAIEAMRDAEPTSDDVSFQDRVDPWMQACFGAEISADKLERVASLTPDAVARLVEAMKHLHDIINCGNCSGSRQSARLALRALKGGE